MAAPPIIKSAADIPATNPMNSPPRSLDFVLSEAMSYRSRDVIQIPQGAAGLWAGSFVDATGAPAATEAAIAGILCYSVNPTDGPVNATIIARDAEVTDAYLQYGALVPATVNTHLATLGIIVRSAVLRNVPPPGFAIDVPPSGPPVSGIQSAEGDTAKGRDTGGETRREGD
jgi:hypothetical protein